LVGRFYETRDIARAFQDVGSFYEALDDLDPNLEYLIGSDIYRYVIEYTGWFDVGNIATISNSYATSTVGGNGYIGGLVGSTGTAPNLSVITNSYATGAVTATGGYIGGLVGNAYGTITDSYATGRVIGTDEVGGLVGYLGGTLENTYATGIVIGNASVGGLVGETGGFAADISNSYAAGTVTGVANYVGGLVGYSDVGITNSFATGDVEGGDYVGGLVGSNDATIFNSYASGNVTAPLDSVVGGLVGSNYGFVLSSYASSDVNGAPCAEDCYSLNDTELLEILNTGDGDDIFALNPSINSGRPYLISNPPLADEVVEISAWNNFSFLSTQVLDSLKKSVGFKAAKSDLSKLDLALLDQVKGGKSAQIIGGKLFSYQSLSTSLSVGSLLQLEINFEANKSLQVWVKSSDDQYVLVGDITFDKDGNAVLPGIEFKKSGQYELIFVNSDKKDLTQPELMNKVIGLTVYVN
jgi:hypothetical protein